MSGEHSGKNVLMLIKQTLKRHKGFQNSKRHLKLPQISYSITIKTITSVEYIFYPVQMLRDK